MTRVRRVQQRKCVLMPGGTDGRRFAERAPLSGAKRSIRFLRPLHRGEERFPPPGVEIVRRYRPAVHRIFPERVRLNDRALDSFDEPQIALPKSPERVVHALGILPGLHRFPAVLVVVNPKCITDQLRNERGVVSAEHPGMKPVETETLFDQERSPESVLIHPDRAHIDTDRLDHLRRNLDPEILDRNHLPEEIVRQLPIPQTALAHLMRRRSGRRVLSRPPTGELTVKPDAAGAVHPAVRG